MPLLKGFVFDPERKKAFSDRHEAIDQNKKIGTRPEHLCCLYKVRKKVDQKKRSEKRKKIKGETFERKITFLV